MKSSIVDENHPSVIIGAQKTVISLLKELKESETISQIYYKNNPKPKGSKLGFLYCLCKNHESFLQQWPLYRCILSTIKTPSCNLAIFLVPPLNP